MILRYFYDDQLAQASYLVGCAASGEALVIDPMRDIAVYIEAARREGLFITHVTETHIHADYVSGTRELAAATGALIYLSEAGGLDWSYRYADKRSVIMLNHGDSFMVGNIRADVLHTPGHTPEHLAFMITDTAHADRPIGVFTGDALFVGDVGRPDLLEASAGIGGSAEIGARQQYATVQLFRTLPDYLQIWPGHGAGSACGKALGAIPSTTLGYEKMFNPALQINTEQDFVEWLLDGQPEPPRYFAVMKQVNRDGPALLETLGSPVRVERSALDAAIRRGAFALDLRSGRAFAQSHIPGSISAPASSRKMSTYVGSLYDYSAPLYLIGQDDDAIGRAVASLRTVGIDDIRGYVTADAVGENEAVMPAINARDLALWMVREEVMVIDVRNTSERQIRHVYGSLHVPLPELHRHMHEIPKDRPVVMYCASGYRSQMAVSFLRSKGWTRVSVIDADEKEWAAALPTDTQTMKMVPVSTGMPA
jgi:hydroxyacylglutathione hydrolase